jgi:hypothetical protein
VRGRVTVRTIGIGGAALLGLVASCLPAFAEPRAAVAGNGALVKVWEERGRVAQGRAGGNSSIAFSVTDASGTRTGTVPPTGDPGRDAAPFLASDADGSLVLLWSRFDGVYRKIAFSRFTNGAWTGFRFVTFGPGDDDLPLFGAGQDASFLYYVVQPNRFFYAPIDLSSGLLIGPPRAIDVAGLARQKPRLLSPGAPSLQGGTDAPVIWRCRDGNCPGQQSRIYLPGDSTVQGGVDVPIAVHQCGVRSSQWGVSAGHTCRKQVLVLPIEDGKTVLAVEFHNGRFRVLDRGPLPAQAQEYFGQSLADLFLPSVCN